MAESNTGVILHFELNKNRTALDLTGPLSDKIANSMDELKQIEFGDNFGVITDMKIGFDGYLYILSYVFEEQFIVVFPSWQLNQVGVSRVDN